jgi:hypothetical protein
LWATLFAAWLLASRCWRRREARTGAVALLACWMGLPVAGTALSLMDPYLTARSFSTPCMVLALVGALQMTEWRGWGERGWRERGWGGFALWAGSLAVAAAMHPLMAAYAAGATGMLMALRSSPESGRSWWVAGLGLCALGVAACLQGAARPESAEYLRVAMTRTYWMLGEWRWYELVGLAAPLGILAMVGWAPQWERVGAAGRAALREHGSREQEARRALARTAVATGLVALAVALSFCRAGSATHLVARMQPLRVFQIVYVVMTLVLGAKLGATLGEIVLRRSLWRWCAAMLLLGGVMLGAARRSFPNSQHVELPGVAAENEWVQAFLWIRASTPKDALFALDADYINAAGEDAQCFRAIAERSALPDYSKDGGEASIAPELTGAWVAGQAAQRGLSAPGTTDDERVAALRPMGVTWVVLAAGARTGFACPYRNGTAMVCRVEGG